MGQSAQHDTNCRLIERKCRMYSDDDEGDDENTDAGSDQLEGVSLRKATRADEIPLKNLVYDCYNGNSKIYFKTRILENVTFQIFLLILSGTISLLLWHF